MYIYSVVVFRDKLCPYNESTKIHYIGHVFNIWFGLFSKYLNKQAFKIYTEHIRTAGDLL